MRIRHRGIKCSRALTDQLVKVLTDVWFAYRSPARGYQGLLNITVDDTVVNTSVPEDATPSVPLIETSYQNNRLVIGLYGKEGYATQNGIWVNFFGQMIPVDKYGHFQAYLEVRQGRPINPMSPSRRGIIKDEALGRLCEYIRDSLSEYFSRTPIEEIYPLALEQFYHDYPAQASEPRSFVKNSGRNLKPAESAPGFSSPPFVLHSARNATNGSTFVARRAGIQQASSATRTSNKAMVPKMSGSVG